MPDPLRHCGEARGCPQPSASTRLHIARELARAGVCRVVLRSENHPWPPNWPSASDIRETEPRGACIPTPSTRWATRGPIPGSMNGTPSATTRRSAWTGATGKPSRDSGARGRSHLFSAEWRQCGGMGSACWPTSSPPLSIQRMYMERPGCAGKPGARASSRKCSIPRMGPVDTVTGPRNGKGIQCSVEALLNGAIIASPLKRAFVFGGDELSRICAGGTAGRWFSLRQPWNWSYSGVVDFNRPGLPGQPDAGRPVCCGSLLETTQNLLGKGEGFRGMPRERTEQSSCAKCNDFFFSGSLRNKAWKQPALHAHDPIAVSIRKTRRRQPEKPARLRPLLCCHISAYIPSWR
jgi:hypothetical protein